VDYYSYHRFQSVEIFYFLLMEVANITIKCFEFLIVLSIVKEKEAEVSEEQHT
jgi:hypothetical protein